eukprot:5631546-Prymnesium_polylepis.2
MAHAFATRTTINLHRRRSTWTRGATMGTFMAARTAHGAKETPPFVPQPQPKPSDADIKKFKEIKEKRN